VNGEWQATITCRLSTYNNNISNSNNNNSKYISYKAHIVNIKS